MKQEIVKETSNPRIHIRATMTRKVCLYVELTETASPFIHSVCIVVPGTDWDSFPVYTFQLYDCTWNWLRQLPSLYIASMWLYMELAETASQFIHRETASQFIHCVYVAVHGTGWDSFPVYTLWDSFPVYTLRLCGCTWNWLTQLPSLYIASMWLDMELAETATLVIHYICMAVCGPDWSSFPF